MELRSLVKWFLPGSIPFLVLGLAIGVAMLYGGDRLRRAGRILLTLLAVFYLLASTRLGADLVLWPLNRHAGHLVDAAAAKGATGVVLLAPGANTFRARGLQLTSLGSTSALRAIEAARVRHLLGDPIVFIVGRYPRDRGRPPLGTTLAKALADLGVPPDRIVIEPDSKNTREHAENLEPYLEKHNVRRFVLVTSPEHMWRSVVTFEAAGYDFVPSSASRESEIDADAPAWFRAIVPKNQNLERVWFATHEYVGLLYYWWKGWS